MAFLETPRFPPCVVRYGYSVSPRYSVTISEVASGRERRNGNWAKALRMFNIQAGPRMEEEILEIYEFWMALGGPEVGFRFKDFSDYKSCRITAEPAATDQTLTLIPGSPGGYRRPSRDSRSTSTAATIRLRCTFESAGTTVQGAQRVQVCPSTWS